MIGKWTTLYDDAGTLKEMRKVGARSFQFIEVLDMNEHCGRDNEGHPRYNAELGLVDLDSIPEKELGSAKRSCGWEDMPDTDEARAEVVCEYGLKAPLGQWTSNNLRTCHRQARSEAGQLARDVNALEAKLDTQVNAMGSTAREFAKGDFMSAMQRGVEAGSPDARILAKMHGVNQHIINDIRPADFLPYLMGYMAAMNGGSEDQDNDIAPEYHRGYARGTRVKAGECPAPGWIKQGTLQHP